MCTFRVPGLGNIYGTATRANGVFVIVMLFSCESNEYNNKKIDPLRANKTFIRKKLGHTAISAIQASSVTL